MNVAISGRWSETKMWMYSAARRAVTMFCAWYWLRALFQLVKVLPQEPVIIALHLRLPSASRLRSCGPVTVIRWLAPATPATRWSM